MKFRSVDFRGGHRTSKAAELQKSVHLLSWMAQPDWTWVGQEAVSKQFHGHLWALLISHLWPGYQISLLHASSCSFQEYCNPHLSRFLYHLSFTIFLLVPVEEKPESSLSLYFFSLSYFLFFFFGIFRKKAKYSSLHRLSYFTIHFIAYIGRLSLDPQLCSFYKV